MSVVSRTELVRYLDEYLDAAGADYGPNGLQVEGRAQIRKLVTGVSACRELFERAGGGRRRRGAGAPRPLLGRHAALAGRHASTTASPS